ncbi:MAG: agmatinase [Bacteroidetes bacterium]|nr:agmatinase [Bacteroidota bacterium]
MNFGGLSREHSATESSSVHILPVPYDKTSTWIKGAAKGPDAIINASQNLELYDIETGTEIYKKGIHTLPAVLVDGTPEEMVELVQQKVLGILTAGKLPVVLGGEHSVSIGAFKAIAGEYNDLTILQIDAHADLRQKYNGSKNNHACVMARGRELANIVQVGIRSISSEELEYVQQDRVFWARNIQKDRNWKEAVMDKINGSVYITIDLDALDPSILPATGTPEPGGLQWHQLYDLLEMVCSNCRVVGFDIVELCPNEHSQASDFLAAKLVYQLLSLINRET